jgi:GTPase SAR1 family protein
MSLLHKKLVVVGDGLCGKTHLLLTFTNTPFNSEMLASATGTCVPYAVGVKVNGQLVLFDMWDTPGVLTIVSQGIIILYKYIEFEIHREVGTVPPY